MTVKDDKALLKAYAKELGFGDHFYMTVPQLINSHRQLTARVKELGEDRQNMYEKLKAEISRDQVAQKVQEKVANEQVVHLDKYRSVIAAIHELAVKTGAVK